MKSQIKINSVQSQLLRNLMKKQVILLQPMKKSDQTDLKLKENHLEAEFKTMKSELEGLHHEPEKAFT